jgi:crossover junction endodeoxyribonuclease RuvC
MLIVGIDPGLRGAGALMLANQEVVDVFDMPVHLLVRDGKAKREIDVHALLTLLSAQRIDHAFLERAGAMPGQGVSSTFAFGRAYGIVIGVLVALGTPLTFVPANKWKRALGVPSVKDGARARASQLLPQASPRWPLKRHDGRAEAALLALYGLRSLAAPRSIDPAQ